MKVIQVIPNFALAGAETMCENLSISLSRMGIEVVAVSMYDYHSAITERLEKEGIRVIYLGKKLGLDLSMIPKMIRIFKSEKPDVVHTHLYVLKYAAPAAVISGVKRRLHTLHNIASKETAVNAQKINYFYYHYLGVIPVALSKEIQRTIVERYHLTTSKIPVINNGINIDKCIVKTDYHTDNSMKLLHIGRFSRQKNHSMLIEAFHEVLKVHPESTLTLVGEGELFEQTKEEVKQLSMEDHVFFYGTTGDVYPLLHDADAFILPSAYEGMPMTLIEAMVTGLPIVTTNVGGIPDMLQAEKEAIITDVSVEAIRDGILRLWDQDLREYLGLNARKRAVLEYSSDRMASRYKRIYEKGVKA